MGKKSWLVIVGGARRLGLELAKLLAKKHNLVLTSSKRHQTGQGEDELFALSNGSEIRHFWWDAFDPELPIKIMTDIEALRGEGVVIHGAVIAAGTFPLAPIGSWNSGSLMETWQLNLSFPLLAIQSLAPHLEDGGCIHILLDACIHRPFIKRLPYSAAKSGMASMVGGLARALAPRIRVVGHAIGTLLPDEESNIEFLKGQSLLNCIGKPEDLCRAIEFAASSDYLTGEIITLDGGWRWV
ncbi:MAG: SDR family oxidoreductase [Holophagales bacterium]|jgi:NAD(P)-dependent dehydrogenase (short-subunit alcohol dehydrogenase family)|nr:SDR family oxidoreductase [Holophagales bacterium]